jgi:3-methyl-2-oxobutanoate hydroxymethyltransferase
MTTEIKIKKKTVPSLLKKYSAGKKLTMITAYDATFARISDDADIDMILVGDSLGMVVQGHDTTLPVTLEDIIYHTRCVSRGSKHSLVIADLPFLSYQASISQAILASGRAIKDGRAGAVKLEGGLEMVETVSQIHATGIPVMAHIGLRPQSVHRMGGYKIQGKDVDGTKLLLDEAKAFEEAGAFAIVVEGVTVETSKEITESVSIPTIGIASGPYCSGQVLVGYDLLGLNPNFNPNFLKKYANGYDIALNAIESFIDEVNDGTFPTVGHGLKRK